VVRSGLIQCGSDRCGPVRSDPIRGHHDRSACASVRSVLVLPVSVRSSRVRLGEVGFNQV